MCSSLSSALETYYVPYKDIFAWLWSALLGCACWVNHMVYGELWSA